MCLTLSKIICTLPQSPDIFRALVHVVVNFEYRLEAGLGLIWVELAQKCNELVIGAICLPPAAGPVYMRSSVALRVLTAAILNPNWGKRMGTQN